MLGRFLLFLLSLVLAGLIRAFWILLGGVLTAVMRFGPSLYEHAAIATGQMLSHADRLVKGRLIQSRLLACAVAGGLWALVGLAVPWLLGLVFFGDYGWHSWTAVTVGFLFGLAVGWRACHLPGWGWWAREGRVQMGENIR